MSGFIAIVLMCDLVLGVCDVRMFEQTIPTAEACQQVVLAGIRQWYAELGPVAVKDNARQAGTGWCESEGLPYDTK